MLTIIAATSENNALGKDNQLVWHLPDDFKRFKSLTSGHFIVMGRKTFESFPKPLPNRTHIIITRQADYEVPEGCIVASNLTKAIALCPKNEEVFIVFVYNSVFQLTFCSSKIVTDSARCDYTFITWLFLEFSSSNSSSLIFS